MELHYISVGPRETGLKGSKEVGEVQWDEGGTLRMVLRRELK